MNTQKPLSAQLAAIFGLSPGAGETEIVATATAWAGERKRQQDGAAFAQRIHALRAATNMSEEMAVQTLAQQDRAGT